MSDTDSDFQVATFEDRPFFEKALRYGFQQGIINNEKISAIAIEAPKGMVQIAAAFGSQYLRPEIDTARLRIVNLASLYLIETAKGDLELAAKLIRDNTFLSLSRGGSNLLKALFAMPEYAILGMDEKGRIEDFLEFWSRKKTGPDYQAAVQQRQTNQVEINLALKLGKALGLSAHDFHDQHSEAEAIIRSALLISLQKKVIVNIRCFNQVEFANMLNLTRSKGIAKAAKLSIELSQQLSTAEQAIITRLQHDILTNDIPKILDTEISLDKLINQLKDRFFIRDHDMEDSASYDALVSKEWSKHTKGKTDIDAILTMLLCIAAATPAKTSLSEKAAKTLVKKIRSEGFQPELASDFIKQHAPHEKQASLLDDWTDFSLEAQTYLLDDWDTNLYGAMRFLQENCYVEKSVKK
ncbi:hypothetical protein [Solimicrobium silvestre]|uniref:Uncharacterized protein n=1 Tax=Solimicrobium silvestre TaxID=2099400 RepID=A0A2S9GV49_9BURK|nr:hypothetical protein [Solimicrobium silvestre]PRC91597.1 hypothetical protein S2091_3713 [Solimicrobium silvestre]